MRHSKKKPALLNVSDLHLTAPLRSLDEPVSTTLVFPSRTYDAGGTSRSGKWVASVRSIRFQDGICYVLSLRNLQTRVDVDVGMGVTRRSRASSQKTPAPAYPTDEASLPPMMQHPGGDAVQVWVCSCGTGDYTSSGGGLSGSVAKGGLKKSETVVSAYLEAMSSSRIRVSYELSHDLDIIEVVFFPLSLVVMTEVAQWGT
ncbi:hypothetical protein L210DRAFT_3502657 [Boletus edulis BED1]|uniref:Uncharacterized protein n=1 Tax=Boletus edulis BED1 TaxID=1328754 RepID=A0AAD4BZI9_BOLED|nr:hypothetical protein L210DRAFT_3502657 [Boletus edulis BED1]